MKKIPISTIRQNSREGVEAQGSLVARCLMLKDTGLDSKAFHYWKMKGLVGTVADGKWAQISFVELLWLKTLESMKKFGCSFNLMKKIYREQFIKAYDDNLAELNRLERIAFYRSKAKMGIITDFERELLIEGERIEKDPKIGAALRTEISYFSQMVVECITEQQDLALIIFDDESYMFTSDIDSLRNSIKPHLFISLSYFLSEMLANERQDDLINKSGIFTQDELRVIRELRNKNVDRIIISFHENGDVKNIDYDEKGLVQGEKVKDVMRILGLRNFDSITLNIRNGTTLSFTKTGKNRIK